MADAHAKPHHDYHLVDPSPWPAVGSISVFVMAVGAISWMHHLYAAAPLVFGAGVIGVLYTMLSWWMDVIKEAEHGGFHTRVVQISHRYGMILFIASVITSCRSLCIREAASVPATTLLSGAPISAMPVMCISLRPLFASSLRHSS